MSTDYDWPFQPSWPSTMYSEEPEESEVSMTHLLSGGLMSSLGQCSHEAPDKIQKRCSQSWHHSPAWHWLGASGPSFGHKQKHGKYSGGEGDEEHNDVSIQSKWWSSGAPNLQTFQDNGILQDLLKEAFEPYCWRLLSKYAFPNDNLHNEFICKSWIDAHVAVFGQGHSACSPIIHNQSHYVHFIIQSLSTTWPLIQKK